MTGLIWSKPLAKERVRPPDFLLSPAGLTSFMRLSLMKAAHAVTVRIAHRKSGYPAAARPADIETVKQLRSRNARAVSQWGPAKSGYNDHAPSSGWMVGQLEVGGVLVLPD